MRQEIKPDAPFARNAKNRFSITRALLGLLAGFAILIVMVVAFSDYLIFRPHPSSYSDSSAILKLTTRDGTRISAVYFPNPAARYTVLFSHGNAEDIGDDSDYFKEYAARGFSVFAYDYHGYGTSGGKPSEANAYQDEDAAFAYLTQQLHIPGDHIIAHGRSLGGGVAVDVASRHDLAGLIMESTFVTTFRVMIPFNTAPYDKFRNIDKIASARCPLLVIHGLVDTLIPIWHGKRLYAKATAPKSYLWVEGAGHNDCADVGGEKYWSAIHSFAQSIAGRSNDTAKESR